MSYLEATLYGAVQGITEFLPVSSSAHLALLPRLMGWRDPGLAFDAALHLGTLAAVTAYFLRDWVKLLGAAARRPRGNEARLLLLLAVSTVPAAAAGLAFERQVEGAFRDPERIAAALILFGALLGLADRFGRRTTAFEEIGAAAAVAIGLSQALALVPGVSRSGVTVTAGLALGLSYDAALRFSFLMSTPVILGAGLLKLRHLGGADMTGGFLWALAVSALTGLGAVHLLMSQLRRTGMRPYVIYRLAVGGAILAACAAGWSP